MLEQNEINENITIYTFTIESGNKSDKIDDVPYLLEYGFENIKI